MRDIFWKEGGKRGSLRRVFSATEEGEIAIEIAFSLAEKGGLLLAVIFEIEGVAEGDILEELLFGYFGVESEIPEGKEEPESERDLREGELCRGG